MISAQQEVQRSLDEAEFFGFLNSIVYDGLALLYEVIWRILFHKQCILSLFLPTFSLSSSLFLFIFLITPLHLITLYSSCSLSSFPTYYSSFLCVYGLIYSSNPSTRKPLLLHLSFIPSFRTQKSSKDTINRYLS